MDDFVVNLFSALKSSIYTLGMALWVLKIEFCTLMCLATFIGWYFSGLLVFLPDVSWVSLFFLEEDLTGTANI